MLFYFIIFCIIGFVVGCILKNSIIAITVIVIITIFWAFVFGPWAFAAFVELIIGYAVAKVAEKEMKKKESSSDIGHVSAELKTAELCFSAVQQKGMVLKDVPEELKTTEVCLAAVQQEGWALEYVPKKRKSPELCFAAIQRNGLALQFVPEELMTAELCLAAVKQIGLALKYMPEELKTAEFYLAVVKNNGLMLHRVPEEQKTAELCLAAVQQNNLALKYAPEEFKNSLVRLQQDANAQYNLGVCYADGKGVSQDYKQAIYWYTKAAEQGNVPAQINLGLCYGNGEGIPQDCKQAVYWYTKAAEQGNVDAQFLAGACYANGKGVLQDYKQAVYWHTKAAEHEDASAQFLLGDYYANGKGVPQDYKQAVYWYTKAAEQGNVYAQSYLGLYYAIGKGVLQDFKQAVYWYTKSAEQGNDDAQFYLGVCYANGKGVPQDYKQAVYWLTKAAKQGNQMATLKLCKIEEKVDGDVFSKETIEIIREIKIRKIKYLVHFTSSKNLESILTDGFMPITELNDAQMSYEFNDNERLDTRKDCICFSIEYPNNFLFDRFKKRNPLYAPWCVIQLNINKTLKKHNGQKYYTALNAASGLYRKHLENNSDIRSTYKAFMDMFQENNPDTRFQQDTRTKQKLKSYLPTNPQAEVLIKGRISSDYIDKVYFNSQKDLDEFKNKHKNTTILEKFCFECSDFYFKSRDTVDWEDR